MRSFGFQKSDLSDVVNASNFVSPIVLPISFDITRECNRVIDQGNRGICVSVSMNDALSTTSKRMKKSFHKDLDYYYLNRKDKKIDGMTVKEAMEIAKRDKDLKLYAKIQDPHTLKHSIFVNGACPVALPVNNMEEQFWKGKPVYGGHCVVFVGWTKNSFILKNSWGHSYGDSGFSYFPYDDWKYVMEAWTILK